jgi:hypothetical protein
MAPRIMGRPPRYRQSPEIGVGMDIVTVGECGSGWSVDRGRPIRDARRTLTRARRDALGGVLGNRRYRHPSAWDSATDR